MLIYLDTNVYCRPFDDQSQERIKGPLHIIVLGWEALVERLGYADATRFIMLLDRGSGDSVQYFRDLWKGKTADDIYREMSEGKLIAEQKEDYKHGTP